MVVRSSFEVECVLLRSSLSISTFSVYVYFLRYLSADLVLRHQHDRAALRAKKELACTRVPKP